MGCQDCNSNDQSGGDPVANPADVYAPDLSTPALMRELFNRGGIGSLFVSAKGDNGFNISWKGDFNTIYGMVCRLQKKFDRMARSDELAVRKNQEGN